MHGRAHVPAAGLRLLPVDGFFATQAGVASCAFVLVWFQRAGLLVIGCRGFSVRFVSGPEKVDGCGEIRSTRA